ncbi:MAG: AAA family ATPase [Chlorobium sp.]|uniref:AAA family ATPase n=1 Tax=Chlorobium sp. TaxID=1095 RepID=UPI002F41F7AC
MAGYIITGGPGSGKSTLIEGLRQHGFRCYSEVSRQLIRHQSMEPDGVLPWKNLPAFASLAFDAMIDQHEDALGSSGICFFDRGIPDIFGYLEAGGYRGSRLGYELCEVPKTTVDDRITFLNTVTG